MSDPTSDALARLVATLQAGLQMTQRSAVASDTFVPFQSSVTGTTSFTCWTPSAGRRYVLRGFAITAQVRTKLAAASANALYFQDGSGATPVCPIAPYEAAQDIVSSAGSSSPFLTGTYGPLVVDLGSGIRGSVVDSVLKIAVGTDISTGVIRFTGVVWGIEVPA